MVLTGRSCVKLAKIQSTESIIIVMFLEVRPIAENGSGEGSKTKNKKKRKKKSQNKNKPTCGYEASNEIGENENESQNETFYDKHVVHIVPQPGW